MRRTLTTLWNLAPLRLTIRLANTALNLVTTQELITALTRTDLTLTLTAIAWLIPWEKVTVLTYRLINHHRTRRQSANSPNPRHHHHPPPLVESRP